MGLSREPARPHDPGYPTLVEFDPSRRAALRAIALAGLSAAGLQLVGCPGGGTGTPPTGTGTGPATGTGTAPATDLPPPTDTDWVPWRDTEAVPPPHPPLGGIAPPREMDLPTAIVVGGGPIDVVFSDDHPARLAVALLVQHGTTPGGVKAQAPGYAAAVKAAAKSLPGSVLDSAQGLETLSTRIQEEVLKAMPGLVLEGVQAAPAHEPSPEPPSSPAPSRSADAPSAAPSAAPSRPAPSVGAAPAPVVATPARAPVTGKRVWVPCGKPGCTSCGAK